MVDVIPRLTNYKRWLLSDWETYAGGRSYGFRPSVGGWRFRLNDDLLVSFGRTSSGASWTLGFNIWEFDSAVWNNPSILMRNSIEVKDDVHKIAPDGSSAGSHGYVWWNPYLRRVAWVYPEMTSTSLVNWMHIAYGIVDFAADGTHTVISEGSVMMTGPTNIYARVYSNWDHIMCVANSDFTSIQMTAMLRPGSGTAENKARLHSATFDMMGSGGVWSAGAVVPTALGLPDADPHMWEGYEIGVDRDYASIELGGNVYQDVIVQPDGSFAAESHPWPGGSSKGPTGNRIIFNKHSQVLDQAFDGTNSYIGQHSDGGGQHLVKKNASAPHVTEWDPHLLTYEGIVDWWNNGEPEAYGTTIESSVSIPTFLRTNVGMDIPKTQFTTRSWSGIVPIRCDDRGYYRWYMGSDGYVYLLYPAVEPPPLPVPATPPWLRQRQRDDTIRVGGQSRNDPSSLQGSIRTRQRYL